MKDLEGIFRPLATCEPRVTSGHQIWLSPIYHAGQNHIPMDGKAIDGHTVYPCLGASWNGNWEEDLNTHWNTLKYWEVRNSLKELWRDRAFSRLICLPVHFFKSAKWEGLSGSSPDGFHALKSVRLCFVSFIVKFCTRFTTFIIIPTSLISQIDDDLATGATASIHIHMAVMLVTNTFVSRGHRTFESFQVSWPLSITM